MDHQARQTHPGTPRTDAQPASSVNSALCAVDDSRYVLLRSALNAAGIDATAGQPDYELALRILDTPQGRQLLAIVGHSSCEAVEGDELGRAWCHHGEQLPTDPEPQDTILDDAKAAVYGDRQQDYGHPREDFTRTAVLWTGLLHHKLAEGEHIEPDDVARCMIAVKLARDVHAPKRDNRVDMAGYALTLDRLETGR